MLRHWILDESLEPQPATLMQWDEFMENPRRILGRDDVDVDGVSVRVSTVFLGIECSTADLYETMVFGGVNDQYQERYCTTRDAFEGHLRTLNAVLGGKKLE